MSGPETIADIVADLRDRADHAARASEPPSQSAISEMLFYFADRIEAATCRESRQAGNAAALREALAQLRDEIVSFAEMMDYPVAGKPGEYGEVEVVETEGLVEIIDAALAKPPRNCDRADIRTSYEAILAWADATDPEYAAFIREHEDEWEPARYEWDRIVEWLLAPAEAKGGAK